MRQMKCGQVLENIRRSMLEDLLYHSPFDACVVFFKEKEDGVHFADYEIAETTEPQIDTDDIEEIEWYQEYLKAKKEGNLVPGLTNILYPDEKYEIMNLKDALILVSMLEYPGCSNDVIITYVNMWIRDISPYRLAQMLNISKQSISQFLNGTRPIPFERKKQIAELLNFKLDEYDIKKTKYIFDKTDL